jgi:hypothetical protein
VDEELSSESSPAAVALKLGILERREHRWAQAALWLRMAVEEGLQPEQEVTVRCMLCDVLLELDVDQLEEALDHVEHALRLDRTLRQPRFAELRYRHLLFPRVDVWWTGYAAIHCGNSNDAKQYLIERLELTSYLAGKHLPHVSRKLAALSMQLGDSQSVLKYCHHTLEAEIPYIDRTQAPESYEGVREEAEDMLEELARS